MDILKIGSEWMKKVVALPIKMGIKKAYGCDMDVKLNDIEFTNARGKIKIHLDMELKMDESELIRISKAKTE